MIALNIGLFVISLLALVKGADWLLESAEKIGLKVGLSHFIVGALIIGLGTSLPELSASIAAVVKGETTIVAANAVGSNIANILLVIGVAAVLARRLTMTKNLIELDLPILVGSTVIFLAVAWDRTISQAESGILILTYVVYFLYTIFHQEGDETKQIKGKYLPAVIDKVYVVVSQFKGENANNIKITYLDVIKLLLGLVLLSVGAKYLIDSIIMISQTFNIAPGVISITAVAIGTSLPELMVSIKAVMRGHSDMAVGNVFGSNIFNALLVVGIPGTMGALTLDTQTLVLGLSFMTAATVLFVISAMSQRIYGWEGALFLIIYGMFIAKLFNFL